MALVFDFLFSGIDLFKGRARDLRSSLEYTFATKKKLLTLISTLF
jgi:hypothetical protein